MLKKLFFVGLFAVVSLAAQGQAGQAYKALPPVYIGGFFSGIHPDFGNNTIDGVGAFLDFPIWSIVGVEGEVRFGKWHTVAGVQESTYTIGPRVAYPLTRNFTPYAKFLIGGGSFTFPFNEGHDQHTVYIFGGGIDYRLTDRFNIRGDFQKQHWAFGSGSIGPTALSAGVSYRIFR